MSSPLVLRVLPMPLGTIRLGIHRGIHLQKTQARFVPSTVGASLVQTVSVGFVFRQAAVYNPAEKRPRSGFHRQPRFTGYPKLCADDFSSQVLHEPVVSLLIRIHFCIPDHSTQLCLILVWLTSVDARLVSSQNEIHQALFSVPLPLGLTKD